jgi:hypothetical protein
MRRVFALCAASSLALSALALTSPAQAAPFHLIKWSGSGICQVWTTAFRPSRFRRTARR